jgi:hypothetical protein
LTRRLRTPDVYILLLSVVALLPIGPLRFTFEALPLIRFLGTLCLFTVPGVALVRWSFDEQLSGPALVPVSFALSAGIFSCGCPFSHAAREPRSLPLSLRRDPCDISGCSRDRDTSPKAVRTKRPLDAVLSRLALASIPASERGRGSHRLKEGAAFFDDIWTYLAHVREFQLRWVPGGKGFEVSACSSPRQPNFGEGAFSYRGE